jgi:endo-1,4-beta-mannosidase
MARFLLGVNYWPRSSAMAMWSRFDAGEIDEDFARIAALGFDVVRFFLTWETFQPEPDAFDERAVAQFIELLERAGKHKLRVMPTLFTGHMSGVNWLPEWTLDRSSGPHPRFRTISRGREVPHSIADFYTGDLLEAQRIFARRLGRRVREHAALFAWDLGNEFSNLRIPHTIAEGDHWSAALGPDLFEASNVGVTGGNHGEDLTEDRNFRLSSFCETWKFPTMHGYSVYSAFARDKYDPEVVPFLCELAASCAGQPVLFSEFGNPACPPGEADVAGMACLDEDEMAIYAQAVLERLQARGALGAFWWCYTDYDPALAITPPFDLAPHELRFGLIRSDGSEKPVAGVLSRFASARHGLVAPPAPMVEESAYFAGLPQSLTRAYAVYCERR